MLNNLQKYPAYVQLPHTPISYGLLTPQNTFFASRISFSVPYIFTNVVGTSTTTNASRSMCQIRFSNCKIAKGLFPAHRAPKLANAAINLKIQSNPHIHEHIRRTVTEEVSYEYSRCLLYATQQNVRNALLDLFMIVATKEETETLKNGPHKVYQNGSHQYSQDESAGKIIWLLHQPLDAFNFSSQRIHYQFATTIVIFAPCCKRY